MKLVLALGFFSFICILASGAAKKAEKISEENVDSEWSSVLENTEQHQAKKYGKDSKYSHHHHSKHQKPLDGSEHKYNQKTESKKVKHIPKNAPHEIPPQEAELQSNLHTSRKHLKDQHVKDAQQDLHLQDLSFEESLKQTEKDPISPHQYQRGHHKTGHFAEDKVVNAEQSSAEVERKLFVEPSSKKQQKHSHSVIEDSFEALGGQHEHKYSKKSNKHKKPLDKVKKNKKAKNSKKEKENKKEKKQKKW